MWGYMKETLLRVRLDPQLGKRINRLRNERDINVSAWVRRLIRNALDSELPDENKETAPATVAMPPSRSTSDLAEFGQPELSELRLWPDPAWGKRDAPPR